MYSARLRKVASMVMNGRQLALGKAFEKYENLRLEVAGKLRACIEALGGKAVDLFQVISKKGGDTVTTEEVRFFLTENQCDLEPEKLDKIFAACAAGRIVIDDEESTPASSQNGKASTEDKADEESKAGKGIEASEPKAAAEATAGKEGQAGGESKEGAGSMEVEAKEGKASEGGHAGQEAKQGQGSMEVDATEPKEGGEAREAKEAKEAKETTEAKGGAEGGEAKESKAAEESMASTEKEGGESKATGSTAAVEHKVGEVPADPAKAPPIKKPKEVLRIGREDFMRIIRVYCKVVKEIILSDNLMIASSDQIRNMDVGEVVEVYQGPVVEPSANALRVHGRALRDGAVGWVTISGNQGVTFLVPGGNVMKVLRPCTLADELKDAATGSRPPRTLVEGEVLEVLDWARTSRSALGVTRIRARVRGDGAVGWVTTIDGNGIHYLEAA
mmetsp:Transcript_23586/g.71274  ORF Transcript_23586/g.71274 Transcript_23586/m.71274 type:complete len:446 (+) Transcript_23586:1-1338(+)